MAKGPSKDFPLYIAVMGDQTAHLHHGNAKTINEALVQLKQLTSDPITTILEVTYCKMFKVRVSEVALDFCPACGLTDRDAEDCNCDR